MELPDAIDRIRPAIVQVVVSPPALSSTSKPNVLGTGFWVHDSGLILTAKHVVEGARTVMANSPGSSLALGQKVPDMIGPPLTIRASFTFIAAEIVEEDQRHDIALLQARPNPFTIEQRPFIKTEAPETDVYPLLGLATLSTAEVRDGERIAISGYPLADPALVTTSGGIASAFGTDIQRAHAPGAPAGFNVPDIADSYLADVAVNPGNSGGPVYRVSNAEVLGICVAFRVGQGSAGTNIFFYNSGLSVIVPIKYGIELIAKHVE